MRLRSFYQLLVIAAERRPAISGDEGRGVQTLGAIPADLGHRQPHQRLDARIKTWPDPRVYFWSRLIGP